MRDSTLIDHLAREGALVLDAAARTGWDQPVPGLDWDVRTVVSHLGAVHRWSTDLVRRALATNETGGSKTFAVVGSDVDLPGWYAEGLAELIRALRTAPADLACYTMLTDVSPRKFWIRRQAHETAIHRADVELAAGRSPEFDTGLAQNGLTELVAGFACTRRFAIDVATSLTLQATDGPARRLTFGGPVTTVDTAPVAGDLAPVDAVVTGTSSALYLWTWNRPAPVTVDGDPTVADLWRRIAI